MKIEPLETTNLEGKRFEDVMRTIIEKVNELIADHNQKELPTEFTITWAEMQKKGRPPGTHIPPDDPNKH
jgi:hypothetical protein